MLDHNLTRLTFIVEENFIVGSISSFSFLPILFSRSISSITKPCSTFTQDLGRYLRCALNRVNIQ